MIYVLNLLDMLIPVSLYGVVILHQVIVALPVAGKVAHPVQILAALMTMMSPLPVVSVQSYFDKCYILNNIIGEQYSNVRHPSTLSNCSIC